MRGRLPEAFLDELLARVDLVELVGERVPLKKAGRDWTACCPFHNERSPSFTVSPTKQFYHCFGCGAHGSAIGFLMNYDRLEFLDAVAELAQRAGMKLPEATRPAAGQESLDALYRLLDSAAGFYHRQLAEHAEARDYFTRRELDSATLDRFNLGYAPDAWDALRSALGTDANRLAQMEKVGLLIRGERGKPYDRFRRRVMFPILDRRGRTIAFGGRIIPSAPATPNETTDETAHDSTIDAVASAAAAAGVRKDEAGPKYLNSPETPLFHKGRELFGLWQVRQAHAKIPRLIVVEGYMDVISLHQAGVTQAVATLGTATTRDHAELLFRQCADVFFCFDGDRAGRQAAWRAVESVLPAMRDGRQAQFLFLPDGEDPDSLVRKEGLDGFERRLARATPLSEFLFAEIGKESNLATKEGKARLAERARPLLGQIPDGAFRDLMFAELERQSGTRTILLAADAQAGARATASMQTRRSGRTPSRSVVRAAITLLVQRPSLAEALAPPWTFAELRQPGIGLLTELIAFCRQRPGLVTGALLEHFAAREEASALHKLAMVDFPGGEDAAQAEFLDAIAQLERQMRQQRTNDLLARQAEHGLNEAEKTTLRDLLAER